MSDSAGSGRRRGRWLAALVCGICCAPTYAGYFDCSVVYDEFDSLMNNQFLLTPDRYVATASPTLTRSQYENLQKNQFKLHEERRGMGVMVFRTDRNVHGKALYRFATPESGASPDLLLEHVIVYGRAADGYAPRWLPPARVKPGGFVDLDTGDTVNPALGADLETQSVPHYDFYYRAQGDESVIESVAPALLYFPIESLCHEPGDAQGRAPPNP